MTAAQCIKDTKKFLRDNNYPFFTILGTVPDLDEIVVVARAQPQTLRRSYANNH